MSLISFGSFAWPAEQISVISNGLGIFVFSMIIYWQYKKVCEARNTVGLSKAFILFQFLAVLFLGVASACRIAKTGEPADRSSINIALCFISVFLLYVNFSTFRIKLENVSAAKKNGMTEAEYYEKEILPNLSQLSTSL